MKQANLMTNQHLITPPPELVQQWYDEARDVSLSTPKIENLVATQAAQWGADQELEACCEWMKDQGLWNLSDQLQYARRPKTQTLNSIALEMLGTIEKMDVVIPEITDTIRRALEALPND